MSYAVLFCLVYGACVGVRRVEDMMDASEELVRRAQGSRRAFCLIDWTPSP